MRQSITLLALTVTVAALLVPASPSRADTIPITIFEDGFESGDLSEWDNVATNRYGVTSNPANVHTGSYALEGTIADDGWGGEINKWFLPGYDEVYVRFDVMFEPGFMNLRGDGNGMHFASVAGNRIDNKWSSHGQAGITPDGTDFFVTTVDPDHSWGDPTLKPFTFYSYFPDMIPPWGNVSRQDDPAVPTIPGQWHEIIIHVDAGTPGQYDGSQALWIDGVRKIDVQNMRWRDTNDLRINEFAIVDYMPGTPQTQHIWFDNVWVGTAFPGSDGPKLHSTVGLVDPATGEWHLRFPDEVIKTFHYGNPADVPFLGDWDCDGLETPGLYRQSDGYAYLRNSNSQGVADLEFFFGNPSDVPLAGDWNGNGCDTLSIYRPSEQRFYIMNALGADDGGLGAADFSFGFGNPGDKPVVGDWDGDGIDEVGLHRESSGLFYYRNTLDTGVASGEFFFGDPGDRLVAGDWNATGYDKPAVFRPATTTLYFRHTLDAGVADAQLTWGGAGWLPVSGTFGLG